MQRALLQAGCGLFAAAAVADVATRTQMTILTQTILTVSLSFLPAPSTFENSGPRTRLNHVFDYAYDGLVRGESTCRNTSLPFKFARYYRQMTSWTFHST